MKNVKLSLLILFIAFNRLAAQTSTVPCNNEDFELALSQPYDSINITGWNVSSGHNYGGCSIPAYGARGNFTVFTGPVLDPVLGFTVNSYFDSNSSNVPAGSCFVKLNDAIAGGGSATRLSKTFIINSIDTLFQYAFFSVLVDGGHSCCDQANISISATITDTVTNISTVLAASNVSLIPSSGISCQTASSSIGLFSNYPGSYYSPWNAYTINLKPYVNKQFRIDVTAMDCNAGGHAGYMYFDAKCGNALSPFDSLFHSKDTARIVTCTSPAALSISTASCYITGPPFNYIPPFFSTFLSGIYSFTIFPGTSLPSYTKTLIVYIDIPDLEILPYTNKICLGESIELSATGASDFMWSTGDTMASIIVSPTVLTTYTVSSQDSNHCAAANYRHMDVYACTGIEELLNNEATLIYPNPNTGDFDLNIEAEKGELYLQNNMGQTVYKQLVHEGGNKIKVRLTPGIYYYLVKEGDSLLKGKISIEN